MKKYPSQTTNGGTTIILDNLQAAVRLGQTEVDELVSSWSKRDPKDKVKVRRIERDRDVASAVAHKGTTMNASTLLESYKRWQKNYTDCGVAITKGDPELDQAISEMAEELHDLALDLAPSLRANYAGFQRSDDGVTASPELLAAGEEMCCFRRKEGSDGVKQGAGEGAYRIIINTDVSWWGQPTDNAALIGALVVLLQQFKPVEVWIQQGWLRGGSGDDGVTLFKLDFTGAFDPTALAFWAGHPGKDQTFSYAINCALGRQGSGTSTVAEIPCDLYLRGDWLKLLGIEQHKLCSMLHTDKLDLFSKWIADTACKIVFTEAPKQELITG